MPKEPPIPMLLGKIYKKLGKIDRAHYYFSLALELESKDAQKIKGFIESLHSTGNDGD
jgi:anaphase-promoting complex subunit 3